MNISKISSKSIKGPGNSARISVNKNVNIISRHENVKLSKSLENYKVKL